MLDRKTPPPRVDAFVALLLTLVLAGCSHLPDPYGGDKVIHARIVDATLQTGEEFDAKEHRDHWVFRAMADAVNGEEPAGAPCWFVLMSVYEHKTPDAYEAISKGSTNETNVIEASIVYKAVTYRSVYPTESMELTELIEFDASPEGRERALERCPEE